MSNKLVQLGVDAFNKQQQEITEAVAAGIVRNIRCEQAMIETQRGVIKVCQDEAKKLIDDTITPESVYGGPLPTNNPNAVTLANSIKKLNESKQATVESVSATYIKRITDATNAIKACEQRIAEHREKLSKLVVETVTADSVMK